MLELQEPRDTIHLWMIYKARQIPIVRGQHLLYWKEKSDPNAKYSVNEENPTIRFHCVNRQPILQA